MPRARQPPPVARACLSLVRHFRNPTLGPPPPHSPSPFVARPPPPTRRHPLFRSSAYPREHPAHQQPRPSRGRLKLTAPRCCAAALACVRASPRLEPRLVIDTLGAARGTYTGYAGPPIRGGRRGGWWWKGTSAMRHSDRRSVDGYSYLLRGRYLLRNSCGPRCNRCDQFVLLLSRIHHILELRELERAAGSDERVVRAAMSEWVKIIRFTSGKTHG